MPNFVHSACLKSLSDAASSIINEEKSKFCGFLHGIKNEQDVIITGITKVERSKNGMFQWSEAATLITRHYPSGTQWVGIYLAVSEEGEGYEKQANDFITDRFDDPGFSEFIIHENPLMFVASPEMEPSQYPFYSCETAGGELTLAWVISKEYSVTENLVPEGMVIVHCPLKTSVLIPHNKKEDQDMIDPDSVHEALDKLQQAIKSSKGCFGASDGRVLLASNTSTLLKEFMEPSESSHSPKKTPNRGSKRSSTKADESSKTGSLHTFTTKTSLGPVFNLKFLNLASSSLCERAPAMVVGRSEVYTTFSIELNGLCFVDAPCTSVGQVVELVKGSLANQVQELSSAFGQIPTPVTREETYSLNALIFQTAPERLPNLMFYPLKRTEGVIDLQQESEDFLTSLRKRVHDLLMLPLTKPLFRTASAVELQSQSDENESGILANVHVGIKSSGVSGGKQYLVDGPYLYYHYLQDNFNDRGWGCAYRSIQTVVSWFKLNYYPESKVPTHKEIQQVLVDMGDKPASFVGTNGWIGSMEVGFYIDQELGVQWRNIMVNSGPELEGKARELAAHFEEHGTPVMMGGGNLAFTLLGVDWNEETGEIMFLILDPHYTGADDLKTIQTKAVSMEGYKATPCGWRSASTFSKETFYSLCLPNKPMFI